MKQKFHSVVSHLLKQGKGILAADESIATCTERFEALGIPSTPEMRAAYREMLFTAENVGSYLSGAILFDETLRQATADGTPFAELLASKSILVGIKVDQGLAKDPQFDGEDVTKGLDGLRARLSEYRELGASFTKWRSVHPVNGASPTAMRENASRQAAYAGDVLQEGLVPIIEPEVLMKGSHSAEEAEKAITEVLSVVIDALHVRDIDLSHVIIKTAMAVAGSDSSKAESEEVAERTVRALKTALPEELGGVVFLSGGQEPKEATANLNAISRLEPLPWPITFSFARALQNDAMKLWSGKSEMVGEAQAAFLSRLSLVKAADAGAYSPALENGNE